MAPQESEPESRWEGMRTILIVIAIVCVIFFLRYAKDFLIPVATALVIAAVLEPFTRRLRAIGLADSIAAGATVLLALVVMVGGVYLISDDFSAAIEQLPALSKNLKDRAKTEQSASPNTVKKLSETAKNLEEAASSLSGTQAQSSKPVVRVETPANGRPSWLRAQFFSGSTTALQVFGQIGLAMLIAYFLLASEPMLRRKLLRASGNSGRQRARMRRILVQSTKQVQFYIGIVLVTNIAVGLAMWPVFYYLEFEQPGLWSLFAGIVHLVPYIGSMAIAAFAAIFSYLSNPDILKAFNTGMVVLVVVSVVATLLGTWLQSRTSRMNQVVVFIGILFWGWMWGLWGLFLGAPIVVIGKVVCDNVPALRGTARLLGE